MTPSQAKRRRKKSPKKASGERYTTDSYDHAIKNATAAANTARSCDLCKKRKSEERCQDCQTVAIPRWHPNQLRHTRATEVRRRYGLEAAQVILGHSRADVTQVYAERDLAQTEAIMGEIV
jgi:integrase